jgi:S1-C subfamily serine protease
MFSRPQSNSLACLILLLAMLFSTGVTAAVYKWVDENGKMHFSQTPPPEVSSQTTRVKMRGSDNDIPINIPHDVLVDYCEDLRDAATEIADQMRNGSSPGRALTRSHGSERELLVKQIIGFVYGFKHGDTTSFEIGSLFYNQCVSGSFTANLKRYIKKTHPELVEGEGGEGATAPGTQMGTAWPVGRGYVITNHHVVDGGNKLMLRTVDGLELVARVVKRDADNDLALLAVDDAGRLPRALSLSTRPAGVGSSVFTVGYPHLDVMGYAPKLTTGIISADKGLRDDARFYQISVPVQAGNSGGPLVDMNGHVVGIVTAKLNARFMMERTGDLPQNVNYALKSDTIRRFIGDPLEASPAYAPSASAGGRTLEQLAPGIQKSVMILFAVP